MSYLKTISISTVLLAQPVISHSKSVDEEMQRCVSAALQQVDFSAKKITVNTGGFKQHELDHAISRRKVEYRMLVSKKASGEELGTVTCSLDQSGDLIAATFEL